MPSLRVSLGDRSYPILIGQGLLQRAGALVRQARLTPRNAVVVSQKPVSTHYEKTLLNSLIKEGFSATSFIVPDFKSSEQAKSQGVFSKLIRKMADTDGKNRSLFMVALGGGVIGDLTGFAASVYRRGVPYIQIPTTLTAQVDSAIGGKTAIDLPEGKNLLGAVYQPSVVIADTDLLSSLPERYWSDGSAEVIKYGVIQDAGLFERLERSGLDGVRKDARFLEEVIFRCAKIKARAVAADELDKKGVRIILNFGHTAGHAIEAASRYNRQYTHGEAVAVGMLVACDIAKSLGVLKDAGLTERLEKVLIKFKLPLFFKGVDLDAISKAMGYDKKAEGGTNRFVLPVALGKVTIQKNIPAGIILKALQKRKG